MILILSLLFCFRYTIVLNGKDAIEEALVKHSIAFADREAFFQEKNDYNRNMKGELVVNIIQNMLVQFSKTIFMNTYTCRGNAFNKMNNQ